MILPSKVTVASDDAVISSQREAQGVHQKRIGVRHPQRDVIERVEIPAQVMRDAKRRREFDAQLVFGVADGAIERRRRRFAKEAFGYSCASLPFESVSLQQAAIKRPNSSENQSPLRARLPCTQHPASS